MKSHSFLGPEHCSIKSLPSRKKRGLQATTNCFQATISLACTCRTSSFSTSKHFSDTRGPEAALWSHPPPAFLLSLLLVAEGACLVSLHESPVRAWMERPVSSGRETEREQESTCRCPGPWGPQPCSSSCSSNNRLVWVLPACLTGWRTVCTVVWHAFSPFTLPSNGLRLR